MATIRKKTNKAGATYYEILFRVSRDAPQLSTKWHPPEGWSQKVIDRELKKQAAEFERKCKAGEIISRKEKKAQEERERLAALSIQTVREYGERVFMPSVAVRCSENSRSSFQSQLDRQIYPVIGECKLPEVTSAMISALLLDYQATGRNHSSVVKVYTVLNLIFKSAYKADLIERNPMDKVDRPRPRKDEMARTDPEAFTVEELRHILKCLDGVPLKWRSYMRFLIDTGCRRGEACALQWQDIDFQSGTVTLSRNLCYTADKGVYEDTPKNSKTRTFDLAPAVLQMLYQLRKEQEPISKWVFTQEDSWEPMHPQSPTRWMQRFAKEHGIQHLHPHKLRHSFATIAITSGADVTSVSAKLGHSDPAVTLRVYSHANEASIKRVGDTFRNAIST